MKSVRYCPDGFMQDLYASHADPYSDVKDTDSFMRTSEQIRRKLTDALGLGKIPENASPQPEVLKTVKRRGYTVETLSTEICPGLNMLCYVLVPENPQGDGIAALCGHGYGSRQIFRQSKSGGYRRINFLDNYQKNFAEALALDGHTVICPEFVGFGEARLKDDLKKPFYISSCETLSHHLLLSGITTAGMRVFQAVRCIDILEKKYGCTDMGCMGISGGGLVTLYTAVLDERITRACVCGYINSFRSSVMSMWHCPDNYIPGILETGEMSDFAAAVSPRKLMMQYGTKDKLFPIEASRKAADRISQLYAVNSSKDSFVPFEFDGKHEVSLEEAVKFFSGR